jgi:hypothetical protein
MATKQNLGGSNSNSNPDLYAVQRRVREVTNSPSCMRGYERRFEMFVEKNTVSRHPAYVDPNFSQQIPKDGIFMSAGDVRNFLQRTCRIEVVTSAISSSCANFSR